MLKSPIRGFGVVGCLIALTAPAGAQDKAAAPPTTPPPALAQPPAATIATFGPTAGSFELRIDNTWYAGGFPLGNGFAHQAPEMGSNTNFFSLGAGLGYFASPHFEVGGSLSYVNLNGDVQIPGVSAFGRFLAMLAPKVAGYGGVGAQFQMAAPDKGSNQQVYGLGVDAGLEFFVTSDWAVRLGLSYRHLWDKRDSSMLVSGDTSLDVLGANWGIAAYF